MWALCLVAPLFHHDDLKVVYHYGLNGHTQVLLRLCPSTICTMIDCMYIDRETSIMHAILCCSKSLDCNKDKYDTQNALWLCRIHSCENRVQSHPHGCPVVGAAQGTSYSAVKHSHLPWKSATDLCRGLVTSQSSLFYITNLVAFCIHDHNCRCFQKHLKVLVQSLRALCLAPGGSVSI